MLFVICDFHLTKPTLMKSSKSLKAAVGLIALLFAIVPCLGQEKTSGLQPGTWTKTSDQGTFTFTVLSENKWEVEFTGDGELDVWGSYAISGKQITFTDEGGEYRSYEDGVYEFKIVEDSLKFSAVDDPVYGRRVLVVGSWSKPE